MDAGENMKRSSLGSFVKGIALLIFCLLALKTLLVADTDPHSSEYFNVAPAIRHISPQSVEVSWTLFPDFNKTTHYQVQYNHTLYGSSTKGTREILANLQPGATYDFSVVTYDNGSAVGVSSASRTLMAPAAPAEIGVYSIGTASVGLFWQKVDTAIKYRIYTLPDILLKEVDAAELKTVLTGLTPGKLYTFRLTAINSTGESLFSVDKLVQLLAPPPVFSVVANQIGPDWFAIKWTPVDNATQYNILVNDAAVASLSADVNEYRVNNLATGTAVSVKMSVVNSTGSSEASEPLIIQLLPATPMLAVSEVSSFTCTLHWSVANGATYYKIYENNEWAIFNVPSTINNVTITEHIFPGMTATYTIKAGNGTGESEHSNPVVVTYTTNSAVVREGGDLKLVLASFYQFKDRMPTAMQGKPLMWVYFPPELEGPALALEASFFDDLTALPELKDIRFIGVFTRDAVAIKGSKRDNLEWKKASAGHEIRIPGHLPMVRFYGPDGMLRNMIRISMSIISPYDVFKELPEAFEKNENMQQLYQESRQKFDEIHLNSDPR